MSELTAAWRPGRHLEALTAAILEGNSGRPVGREQIVGHKKVDLLVTTESLDGSERLTLVECKDLERPLTQRQLAVIWSDYSALIEAGHADELLVVTSKPATPAAQTFARQKRQLLLQDIASLATNALGLRGYLEQAVQSYQQSPDGLSRYFIDPVLEDGTPALSVIKQWIRGTGDLDPTRPLAILGSYGLGKSSLATRLSSDLAQAALDDPTQPIPVTIRLGELTGANDLRALLGRHFTDIQTLRGYSFRLLQTLNQHGRLVIILDGFDEMRRLQTLRDLRFNLRQLAQLYDPASRLILLGRPTAFETDDEADLLLHGVRKTRAGIIRDPEWPDYQELLLGSIPLELIPSFVQRYLAWFLPTQHSGTGDTAETTIHTARVLEAVLSDQLIDLSRRPVQLRMLATVIPNYHGDTSGLDLAEIYYLFIDHLVDEAGQREEGKEARLSFSKEQRREFLQKFAYWHWTQGDSQLVTTDQIPDELIAPFVPDGSDVEATRRDLVAGAPLDRRFGERVRFGHLSFQEFLVAEELWTNLLGGKLAIEDVAPILTPEVADFMAMLHTRETRRLARKLLVNLEGVFPYRLMRACFEDDGVVADLLSDFQREGRAAPWETLLLQRLAEREHAAGKSARELRWLTQLLSPSPEGPSPRAAILSLMLLLESWMLVREPNAVLNDLLEHIAFPRREVERFTNSQLMKSRSEIIYPLGGDYVGDMRKGNTRVGRVLRGHRMAETDRGRRHVFLGVESGSVAWLPTHAIAMANALRFDPSTSTPKRRRSHPRGDTSLDVLVDFRGLRPFFFTQLKDLALLEEWMGERTISGLALRGETLAFIDSALHTALTDLKRASDSYSLELAKRAQAGRAVFRQRPGVAAEDHDEG